MRSRVLISLVLGLFLFAGSASGQQLGVLIDQYQSAYSARDYATAGPLWRQIYARSPRKASQLKIRLEVLTDPQAPAEAAIDTLIRLAKQFPLEAGATSASIQRALLFNSFPEQYVHLQIPQGIQALSAHPNGEAAFLLPPLPDQFRVAYANAQLRRGELLGHWFQLDRYLFRRILAGDGPAQHYRHVFRALMLELWGDCGQLPTSSPDERLMTYALCPNSVAVDLLPPRDSKLAGWSWRTWAEQSYNQGEFEKARDQAVKGAEMEEDSILKADYYVLAGMIEQRLGRYRNARKWYRKARESAPDWPLPYLELARLYIISAKQCSWSSFDQKAVYWLALDEVLAIKARQSEPSPEISEAFFEYRQQLPTAEELRFQGLQLGDTWPIRCWMNTVTTVRLP